MTLDQRGELVGRSGIVVGELHDDRAVRRCDGGLCSERDEGGESEHERGRSLSVSEDATTNAIVGIATRVSSGAMRPTYALLIASSIGCSSPGSGQDDASASVSISLSATTSPTGDTDPTTTPGTDAMKLDLGPGADLPDDTEGVECAAQMLEAEVSFVPVDVLLVIDTSSSMNDAINAVEQSINADFAQIMGNSGLDYRVIVAGDYPPGEQLDICISMPLSGTDCNPPPAIPAITDRYFHYDGSTGSSNFLQSIIAWYSAPDPFGLAPGGISDWLRPEANKIILAMTDGNSAAGNTADGDAFDAELLALPGNLFGSAGMRNYVFYSFISMPVNNPPTAPWLPADPIAGQGGSIQQVSVLSGGWRFPLSQAADFDVVFQQIAQGVVESTPVACSFPIPAPPEGETIDPDTIEVDYLPGGVGPAQTFHQVVGPGDCAADAFYIDSDTVFLCPDACTLVQGDQTARLDVRYGCDVGFDPQG